MVTLGEGGVGKTSLIMRYVYGVFSGVQQTTIGSSFVERDVQVESAAYKLRLWDTAGQACAPGIACPWVALPMRVRGLHLMRSRGRSASMHSRASTREVPARW